MIKSMTGYGRGEAETELFRTTVEIRTVNHRFLEIVCRLPRIYQPFEERIKKYLKNGLTRGRVEVFLSAAEQLDRPSSAEVRVDEGLALAYYQAYEKLAQLCGQTERPSVREIARVPGVLLVDKQEDDEEALWAALEPALASALASLLQMRTEEGGRLADDLLGRGRAIAAMMDEIKTCAPLVVEEYRRKLNERIQDMLGAVAVDEAKLANEVAFFADKASIQEELTRMDSHLQQLEQLLSGQKDEPVGRTLDFLLQEMNREINTIGSKANSLPIGKTVIAVKRELEKIR